jgi:hypothetical protein
MNTNNDSTEARTGNTAAEQAAYWRGFEEAQLNAQHNAKVRADAPDTPRPSWLDGGADAVAMAREDGLLPAASAVSMNTNNGWKLVPVEPTDEMEVAAENDYEQTGATFPRWKSAYAAMLAAAPTQPAQHYQWLITVAQMKVLAAELIRAAESMGGDDEESYGIELVLAVAPAATVKDDDGVWNEQPILTVRLEEYPEEGVYPIDPQDPTGGRVDTPPAAPTAPAANGWLDIASAPKDGTEILLTNGADVSSGNWHHDERGTTEYRDMDGRWIGQDDHPYVEGWIDWKGGMTPDPTHWMPLPAAPGSPASTVADEGAKDDWKPWERDFEAWWENHGQYCRAGGGQYEKTFAYHAYEAALASRPAPAAGDALDAARYRWLRDQDATDGIAIVMKNKHFKDGLSCAENIDSFIDAALSASQQGGE